MKKIIVPETKEQAELICDVTGKPAVAKLTLTFSYGSDHDGEMLEADLSNEIANDVLALLQAKYVQFRMVDYFP
ncbi:MAG: hypothetical protein AAB676_21715 [Verrucomicrobiota bacterium]